MEKDKLDAEDEPQLTEEELRLQREEEERLQEIEAERKKREHWRKRFQKLLDMPLEMQADFFLKRYIFTLNQDGTWKEVKKLAQDFLIAAQGESELEPDEATEFLRNHDLKRSSEDYLTDDHGSLSFIEFCCIKYKPMILKEFFQRYDKEPDVDLSQKPDEITNQNTRVMEEMFSPPAGLDPALEKLMAEFSLNHAKREKETIVLQKAVKKGGVKGLTAKNQLNSLENEDSTQMNTVEAKIGAAVKRAQKAADTELARLIALDEYEKQQIQLERDRMARIAAGEEE